MGTSIFNIGVSGLNAAQAGLLTTSHNISNASTPGYNRQQIIQSTNIPQYTSAGFMGQGTNVQSVRRVYSDFLYTQVTSAQTQSSELQTYASQIDQIDNLLGDATAGLSPSLSEFFSTINQVAVAPTSIPSRQSVLSSAQALVSRLHAQDERLTQIRDGIDSQISSTISGINSYAVQIAELNQRIVVAEAGGANQQPANDLRDQRDQLLSDLNTQVRATAVKGEDGSYNVFIGNGQPLVVGTQTYKMRTIPSREDPSQMTVGINLPSGGYTALPESLINGGVLGGLVSFRSETLDGVQNALGRIAVGLATAMNEQNRLGQDLNGNMGGDIFSLPTPKVNYPVSPVNTGTGVLTVSIDDPSALTNDDYRLISLGAGNFDLMRVSDRAIVQSNFTLPTSVAGMAISASGTAVAGDTFLIQPVRTAARDITVKITDPREIAAAAPILGGNSLNNTGSGTITLGTVNAPPPPNANLTQPVTITFTSATTFDVTGTGTGNPTGVTYTPGADITYNGWTVQISGTPAVGDEFTVSPNTAGVGDGRNATLMAALQTEGVLDGGASSINASYTQLVSSVGNKSREISVTATAQDNLVQQTIAAQQSFSGVNLDEEAANLIRYQQAYQASGKMIEIASKLFDTLLSIS